MYFYTWVSIRPVCVTPKKTRSQFQFKAYKKGKRRYSKSWIKEIISTTEMSNYWSKVQESDIVVAILALALAFVVTTQTNFFPLSLGWQNREFNCWQYLLCIFGYGKYKAKCTKNTNKAKERRSKMKLEKRVLNKM